ncbi:MAG: tetratricopeptide repeat protein [Candidatus Methylomirabilia bacterium]
MKRAATLLLCLLAIAVCPARSFGAIQEVADNDGNVTHYKYTDRNGSLVFTDALAKIPEEYRKKNKLVRVGPPKKCPAAEAKTAAQTPPLPESPEDVLQRLLQARDYAAAAKHCESSGDPGQAAANYLKANLFSEAAALFEAGQDFLCAAETYLKAGNLELAAACFERGGDLFFQTGFFAEAAENFSLANDLARAAAAYEGAGSYLQAAQAYETAGGDKEKLATLYEKGEDYYQAGRLFVKLGQLDRALNVLQQVDPAASNYRGASLLVGMIFLKKGMIDLAREKFLKIIDNQPVGKSNLEPYYFLALCHGHAGEADAAKAIFAKILAEDYNYRDVRKRLGG